MKVTSIIAARSIWLFDVADLNPEGRYFYDRLFKWLVDRYHFAKAPAHSQDQQDNAWNFLDGRFIREGCAVDVIFKIFNDGVVAETRSTTDDADAFLTDLLSAVVHDLGLTFTESMVHKRTYVSELNLTLDASMESLGERLHAFCEAVSRAFGQEFSLTAVGFSRDPASTPAFRVERKANLPFAMNKYWSIAGLSTHQHIELLQEFEALLR